METKSTEQHRQQARELLSERCHGAERPLAPALVVREVARLIAEREALQAEHAADASRVAYLERMAKAYQETAVDRGSRLAELDDLGALLDEVRDVTARMERAQQSLAFARAQRSKLCTELAAHRRVMLNAQFALRDGDAVRAFELLARGLATAEPSRMPEGQLPADEGGAEVTSC